MSSRRQKTTSIIDIRAVRSVEIEFDYHGALDEELPQYNQHSNALLASAIELDIVKHSKRCHKKTCQECFVAFLEDEVISDDFIDKLQKIGMYVLPSQGTFDIVKVSNRIIELIGNSAGDTESYEIILKTIHMNLDMDSLFKNTKFQDHNWSEPHQMSHKEAFIRKIIESYMKLQSHHVSEIYENETKKDYIRHKLRKQIHLAGQ